MFDDFDLDINLNEVWNEVKQLYVLMSHIGLEWTGRSGVTHTIAYIDLFFGAWLVYEIMNVFFGFAWHDHEEARNDVWDD